MLLLGFMGDIWDKIPPHAQIILGVAFVLGLLTKPTILIFQWIRQIRKRRKERKENSNELYTPLVIKLSPRKKKIMWYKERLKNHNIQFQFDELIKYELDTNKYSFGDPERTRLFRQLARIYLGVLSDYTKKPLDSKIHLDKMSQKELLEFFTDYILEMSIALDKKFKENFTDEFYNLVIMDEDKGFVRFIDKHKKSLIRSVKEIITQDIKFYDGTNYRKLWEIYSLVRILLGVGLELFMEFYDEFNGELDGIVKKK